VGYHHSWRVPEEYARYDVFTVVRNPYDRCLSAWWFRCQDPSRREGNPMFGWPFDRFLRSVLAYRETAPRRPTSVAESSLTQKQYVDLSGARLALRLEAPADLRLLPFVGSDVPPLPRENVTTARPAGRWDQLGGREEQLVWDYCAEDFEAFGYERRPCGPGPGGGATPR
jgi:hypothetical protein